MQLNDAVKILETLADGIDPITGSALPAGSLCQHPQVVRALYTVIQELRQTAPQQGSRRDERSNAGKSWSPAEEAELLRGFEACQSIPQLAKQHGRTTAAIHGRLYRLGKVGPYNFASGRHPQSHSQA